LKNLHCSRLWERGKLFRAGLEAGKVPSKESGNKKPLKSTLVQKSMKLLLPTCHTHTHTPHTPLSGRIKGATPPHKRSATNDFCFRQKLRKGKYVKKENMAQCITLSPSPLGFQILPNQECQL